MGPKAEECVDGGRESVGFRAQLGHHMTEGKSARRVRLSVSEFVQGRFNFHDNINLNN